MSSLAWLSRALQSLTQTSGVHTEQPKGLTLTCSAHKDPTLSSWACEDARQGAHPFPGHCANL